MSLTFRQKDGKLLVIGGSILSGDCCCSGQYRGLYTIDCASRMYVWTSSELLSNCDSVYENAAEYLGGCNGYYWYGKKYYCETPVDDTTGHGSAVASGLLPCCCNPCVYCSPSLPSTLSITLDIPQLLIGDCANMQQCDTTLEFTITLNKSISCEYSGISTPVVCKGDSFVMNIEGVTMHFDDETGCYTGWDIHWRMAYPPNPDYGYWYGAMSVTGSTPCDPAGSITGGYSFHYYGDGNETLFDCYAWTATIS